MSTRRLRLVGGAGDPDDTLVMRIDIVTAAQQLVAAIDARGVSEPEWHTFVAQATDDVYRKTKRYMRACERRKG